MLLTGRTLQNNLQSQHALVLTLLTPMQIGTILSQLISATHIPAHNIRSLLIHLAEVVQLDPKATEQAHLLAQQWEKTVAPQTYYFLYGTVEPSGLAILTEIMRRHDQAAHGGKLAKILWLKKDFSRLKLTDPLIKEIIYTLACLHLPEFSVEALLEPMKKALLKRLQNATCANLAAECAVLRTTLNLSFAEIRQSITHYQTLAITLQMQITHAQQLLMSELLKLSQASAHAHANIPANLLYCMFEIKKFLHFAQYAQEFLFHAGLQVASVARNLTSLYTTTLRAIDLDQQRMADMLTVLLETQINSFFAACVTGGLRSEQDLQTNMLAPFLAELTRQHADAIAEMQKLTARVLTFDSQKMQSLLQYVAHIQLHAKVLLEPAPIPTTSHHLSSHTMFVRHITPQALPTDAKQHRASPSAS